MTWMRSSWRIFSIADALLALLTRLLSLSVRFASLELKWGGKRDKLGQKGGRWQKICREFGAGSIFVAMQRMWNARWGRKEFAKNILRQARPVETYIRPLELQLLFYLFVFGNLILISISWLQSQIILRYLVRFMMVLVGMTMICDAGDDLGNAKNVESSGMLPSAVHVAMLPTLP